MPWAVAESVTTVLTVTVFVAMVTVPVRAPAGMVMLAGAGIAAELLVNVTVIEPGPAGPVRATVPVTLLPPFTLVGLSVKDRTPTGKTLSELLLEAPFAAAAMLTEVVEATAAVPMLKVPVRLPVGIVMLLRGLPDPSIGWATEGLLLLRLTMMSPGAAGASSLT